MAGKWELGEKVLMWCDLRNKAVEKSFFVHVSAHISIHQCKKLSVKVLGLIPWRRNLIFEHFINERVGIFFLVREYCASSKAFYRDERNIDDNQEAL